MPLHVHSRFQRSLAFVTSVLVLLGAAGLLPGLTAAAPATPATTAATPQFGIGTIGNYPKGYFTLSLQPGQTGHFTAGVINFGKVSANLKVYAANAVNPVNGGFAATDQSIKPAGSTTWVTLSATPFTLAAGSQRPISFTITVPSGTAPGQYITALVASTADAIPIPGSTTFNQVIRSVVPVEITVPGPIKPGFTLGHPTFNRYSAGAMLQIPIANTGNILVKPAGKLTVSTPNGRQVMTLPIKMQAIYAGNTTSIELTLPAQFKPGDYVISLTLKDSATGATASVTDAKATLAPPETPATPGR